MVIVSVTNYHLMSGKAIVLTKWALKKKVEEKHFFPHNPHLFLFLWLSRLVMMAARFLEGNKKLVEYTHSIRLKSNILEFLFTRQTGPRG